MRAGLLGLCGLLSAEPEDVGTCECVRGQAVRMKRLGLGEVGFHWVF